MGDEKLPDYLEGALKGAEIYGDDAYGVETPRHRIVAAIHRYAREREAAALERAAKVCAEVDASRRDDSADDCELCAKAIRAMIQNEPVNG